MSEQRKNAGMKQVLKEIKPYTKKRFLSSPKIREEDFPVVCQVLLSKYKNVQLFRKLSGNRPCLEIQVKELDSTTVAEFIMIE